MRLVTLGIALLVGGCGYSAIDGDMIGQIKTVGQSNPVVCPGYTAVGISLGILRDGTGSMSTHDVAGWVPDRSLIPALQRAKDTGAVVALTYKEYRAPICKPDFEITGLRIVQGKP